ncbi:MAG: hypothetical protein RR844_05325 [Clostridium sp.]
MKQKDNITETNIVPDNISTMVNKVDVDYDASPCVVMNNLVKDHNLLADEMGDVSRNTSAVKNNVADEIFSLGVSNLSLNLHNEVKEYAEPVDYETAFGEYYPEDDNNKDKNTEKKKS